MQERRTDALLAIWAENDRRVWSDEAFAAIQQVLTERHVEPPRSSPLQQEQHQKVIKITAKGCMVVALHGLFWFMPLVFLLCLVMDMLFATRASEFVTPLLVSLPIAILFSVLTTYARNHLRFGELTLAQRHRALLFGGTPIALVVVWVAGGAVALLIFGIAAIAMLTSVGTTYASGQLLQMAVNSGFGVAFLVVIPPLAGGAAGGYAACKVVNLSAKGLKIASMRPIRQTLLLTLSCYGIVAFLMAALLPPSWQWRILFPALLTLGASLEVGSFINVPPPNQ